MLEAPALNLNARDAGAALDITEVHTYPDQLDTNGVNQNAAGSIAALRTAVPGATVWLGEVGSHYCESQNEALQIGSATDGGIANILAAGRASGVTQALNWGLFDYAPTTTCTAGDSTRFGIGFNIDTPRDLYGYLAEQSGGFSNGDFERDSTGWLGGGAGTSWSLARLGPSTTDAATGAYYVRLTSSEPGDHWVCTPYLLVSAVTHFIIGGYVRSDFPVLAIALHTYDPAAGYQSSTRFKAWPGPWGWKHLQNLPESAGDAGTQFDFGPLSGIEAFAFCIGGTAPDSANHYLDLDAISARAY
jgi:hypothetical protein